MAASGVGVHDDCKTRYGLFKSKKIDVKYMIFKLSDDLKQVVIESEGSRANTYDDFVNELKEAGSKKQCRYAVFDCPYVNKAGVSKSKLVFFYWGPEQATIKQKMVYSSSKDVFKAAIDNGLQSIQANEDDELDWKEIEADLISKDRT